MILSNIIAFFFFFRPDSFQSVPHPGQWPQPGWPKFCSKPCCCLQHQPPRPQPVPEQLRRHLHLGLRRQQRDPHLPGKHRHAHIPLCRVLQASGGPDGLHPQHLWTQPNPRRVHSRAHSPTSGSWHHRYERQLVASLFNQTIFKLVAPGIHKMCWLEYR